MKSPGLGLFCGLLLLLVVVGVKSETFAERIQGILCGAGFYLLNIISNVFLT